MSQCALFPQPVRHVRLGKLVSALESDDKRGDVAGFSLGAIAFLARHRTAGTAQRTSAHHSTPSRTPWRSGVGQSAETDTRYP
jgi:hypothetical protein